MLNLLQEHKNIFISHAISKHWKWLGTWNACSWKTNACFSCIVNIMAAGDLSTARFQDNNSHGIDRASMEYPGTNTRSFYTLRLRQNDRHFADGIFKCTFLNQNAWIERKISLRFVLKIQINNIPALVQVMDWCRPGDKPLSEPMMVGLLAHICVTQHQWVKVRDRQHRVIMWLVQNICRIFNMVWWLIQSGLVAPYGVITLRVA